MNITREMDSRTSGKMSDSPNQANSPNISSEPMTPLSTEKKSLEGDLRKLLSDERFQDVSLKCSDNIVLRACKNILACRTEVFNDIIFDKSKKNIGQQNQFEFDKIDSTAMKFILEYLYTSKNVKEKLNVSNIIEIYYSAIYFKLDDLQNDIITFTMESLRDGNEEFGKNLLSECIEKFSLAVDNAMSRLLVEWVAKIQLFPELADSDYLSLQGLQYLLEKTCETNKSFATYELTLFEYTLLKTKHAIIEDKNISKKDPYNLDYDSNTIERLKDRLNPLLKNIVLGIMDPDIVRNKLECLGLFSEKMIMDAYRFRLGIKNKNLQPMRGRLIFKWKSFDKESDSGLSVIDNGFTVNAKSGLRSHKSVMGDLIVKGNGMHRWDILVGKISDVIYIGICGTKDQFDKPRDKGFQGCALCSDGYLYNKNTRKWSDYYKFKEGDVINIVVNVNITDGTNLIEGTDIRHCYFGINDNIRYENFGYSFPSEVHPFVTLGKNSAVTTV